MKVQFPLWCTFGSRAQQLLHGLGCLQDDKCGKLPAISQQQRFAQVVPEAAPRGTGQPPTYCSSNGSPDELLMDHQNRIAASNAAAGALHHRVAAQSRRPT